MKLLLRILVAFYSAVQANFFVQSSELPYGTINKLMESSWDSFKSEFNKEYDTIAEEIHRMKVFKDNKLTVIEHNKKYALGLVPYKMALNELSDMHISEVIEKRTGLLNKTEISGDLRRSLGLTFMSPANVELPASIDWRKLGAVGPVRHQGHCGSCWAFSAIGSLEGQLFRKSGYLVPLSVQNLLDCSISYGNHQCTKGGGLMHRAFKYIKDSGGINTEKNYPYLDDDDVCKFDKKKTEAKVTGFTTIPDNDVEKMKAAVATVGPISVCLHVNNEFRFYAKGVYEPPDCVEKSGINHAVLIVGYGTDGNGRNYWIIKNSWGRKFGKQGYMHIAQKKGTCTTVEAGVYPLL